MRLALLGTGRMGEAVADAAHRAGHEITVSLDSSDNAGAHGIDSAAFSEVDVALDFSAPGAVFDNIRATIGLGIPMVIGTTGWDERHAEARSLVLDHGGALVYGSNFSIGANLLARLAEHAAALFDPFEDYDAYVWEHHHRGKADAPSGTALALARRIIDNHGRKRAVRAGNAEGRVGSDELHVASLRAGHAFGEHRVGFDGPADAIQIVHTARGRQGFAEGALVAAGWIVDRSGFFAFEDVLDDVIDDVARDGDVR